MTEPLLPGPPPRDEAQLRKELRRKDARTTEVARRGAYPYSASSGDNSVFRVYPDPGGAVDAAGNPVPVVEMGYGNGVIALGVTPSTQDQTQTVLTGRDMAGTVLLRSDDYVRYGFAAPAAVGAWYLTADSDDNRWTLYKPSNVNVERSMYVGSLVAQNPVLALNATLNVRAVTTTPTGQLQYRVSYVDATGATVTLPSSDWISQTGTGAPECPRQTLLPAAAMGCLVTATIVVRMSANANGSSVVSSVPRYLLGRGTYPGWDTAAITF